LQFMEKFLSHKIKKPIVETNISEWRRTVCGDLTSVFHPYNGEKIVLPTYIDRVPFIESIHKAQFKNVPSGYKQLTPADIAAINRDPASATLMPKQEPGIRPSCALPYELSVNGSLAGKVFRISFAAGNMLFGKQAAGAPFNVYAPGRYESKAGKMEAVRTWSYAVTAGDQFSDEWPLVQFENGDYHLRVYGPNGFFREFKGNSNDPDVRIIFQQSTLIYTGDKTIEITDHAYKSGNHTLKGSSKLNLDLSKSFGWYDFSVKVKGFNNFEQRFAGRVETGKTSFSDPLMGRVKL